MKQTIPALLSRLFAATVAVGGLSVGTTAHAENHALIMWIGTYANPRANLPGIDLDAGNARKIAMAMGVPASNIIEVSNQGLTKPNIAGAMDAMTSRIARDDKVFIYYSGHGSQVTGVGGAKCTEGIVSHELSLYEDVRMQDALNKLGAKASQVIMMNDSCFSGGAATKEIARSTDDLVAKFWSGDVKAGSVVDGDYQCGEAVNKMSRNLEVIGASNRGPQVLYIAASAANEVSFATPRGSLGTLAWASCLGVADSNRSGSVDGDELRACAQRYINGRGARQTITLVGNSRLPLTFAGQSGGDSAVNPLRTLEDIRATRDPSQNLTIASARSSMRIRQDFLDFSVSTDRPGYLYLLHVGSDGKTFDLLFPNDKDSNNYINAGTHRFPRESWRVRAAGPVGTSYVMAVISATKKDLSKGMDMSTTFANSAANEDGAKNLVSEATGASGGSGRIGASEIIAIREVE